jgi:hypothetical protein
MCGGGEAVNHVATRMKALRPVEGAVLVHPPLQSRIDAATYSSDNQRVPMSNRSQSQCLSPAAPAVLRGYGVNPTKIITIPLAMSMVSFSSFEKH